MRRKNVETFVENVDRQKICSMRLDKLEQVLYYTDKNRCSPEQKNE